MPQSTAQSDFGKSELFMNGMKPREMITPIASKLKLDWDDDSAIQIRETSEPVSLQKTYSHTNLSHSVERLIKNYPESSTVLKRTHQPRRGQSSPGLIKAMSHINMERLDKSKTLTGRLEEEHLHLMNSSNYNSVSQKGLDEVDTGKWKKYKYGKRP